MPLTLYPLQPFPMVHPGDDLPGMMAEVLEKNDLSLQDGDILVVAQKVVSKDENRLVNLTTVTPSERALHYADLTKKDPRLI